MTTVAGDEAPAEAGYTGAARLRKSADLQFICSQP
jgi:hypothetical protein